MVDKNGKIKYSWENMEHVTTRGKGSSSQQVENRTGTDKDANLFAKQSKGMRLGLFGASGTQSSGSARPQPTDLALEDQPARSMNLKQLRGPTRGLLHLKRSWPLPRNSCSPWTNPTSSMLD